MWVICRRVATSSCLGLHTGVPVYQWIPPRENLSALKDDVSKHCLLSGGSTQEQPSPGVYTTACCMMWPYNLNCFDAVIQWRVIKIGFGSRILSSCGHLIGAQHLACSCRR